MSVLNYTLEILEFLGTKKGINRNTLDKIMIFARSIN